MGTDKLRKYVLPNIPYLFIGWAYLKVGTAYRLAAGAGFGQKLLGIMQTIGVAFADFGASTLDFSLKFWVRDYDVSVSTASDIRVEIEREFREQRIEIAFPQLDVNIKELPPRTRAPQPPTEPRAGRRRAPRRPRKVLPAGAKGKPDGKNAPAVTPDDGDDDENNN